METKESAKNKLDRALYRTGPFSGNENMQEHMMEIATRVYKTGTHPVLVLLAAIAADKAQDAAYAYDMCDEDKQSTGLTRRQWERLEEILLETADKICKECFSRITG